MAKRILPKSMWLITRNVRWREMRLSPSPKLNRIFSYVVFQVAAKRGVRICAMCVMSNHWHAVIYTEKANLPAFMRDVHAQLAQVIGAAHGDVGGLWDGSDQNEEQLEDDGAILRAIGYVMANPVAPGGVKHARSWPGVRVAWPAKATPLPRARPYYRTEAEGGKMPKTVLRQLHRPGGFEGVSDEELASRIDEACKEAERIATAKVAEKGGTYRSRREILRQSRYARATSKWKHFEVRRRVKTMDPDKRRARIEARQLFASKYAYALERWLAGDRDVLFPYGTYKMVVLHGAKVEPPPLASA